MVLCNAAVTAAVLKGAERNWYRERGNKDKITRIPMQTVTLYRLNANSTACYDFEGLLEFHSRLHFVQRPHSSLKGD